MDILDWCRKFPESSLSACLCVVKGESGGNANAELYSSANDVDIGLFQINTYNWAFCNNGQPPCDLETNLACAKKVFGFGGNSWHYWVVAGRCRVTTKAMNDYLKRQEALIESWGYTLDEPMLELLLKYTLEWVDAGKLVI